jgi:hypothetical protein
MLWTWQAASLALAVIACLLFFIAAAVISINHARQWRRIEKHFDAGKQKLMNNVIRTKKEMHNTKMPGLIESVHFIGNIKNAFL